MNDEQQASGPASAPQPVVAPFTQAYADYERGLNAAWNTKNVAGQVAKVQQKYAAQMQMQMQMQPSSAEAQQRVSSAYQQWVASASGTGSTEETRRALVEAYNNYLRALQEALPAASTNQSVAEAYRSYLQEVREAASVAEIQREGEQALREFKLAVQKAWAQVDVHALDWEAMAYIGQLLQAAAMLTATFAVQLSQQHMRMAQAGLV